MSTIYVPKQIKANKTENKGFGIFAAEQILIGTVFLKFEGPLINWDDIDDSASEYKDTYMQIDKKLYINIANQSSVLVNHSCGPNTVVIIDGQEAYLKAIETINSNEEITFDYSLNWFDDDSRLFIPECLCGKEVCRKSVTSFNNLPKELADKYIVKGLVPEFALP